MKKLLFILLTSLTLLTPTAFAQSPQVKKAAQAIFSLNTFRADGTLISTSHGIFVSSTGDAISEWKPFVGAATAVVIDASGKKYTVDGLISANDLYDVCKFHVKGSTPSAKPATTTNAEKSNLWLACYAVKNPRLLHATVTKVETFKQSVGGSSTMTEYPFYILSIKTPEDVAYCPLLNDNGEVAGLLQSSKDDGTANAVSALYPSDMVYQPLGPSATTLAQSVIPALLPKEYKDAQLALILAGQQKKGDAYKAVIEQFISSFPNKVDGYEARARYELAQKDIAAADKDMQTAISVAEDKAEAHHTLAEMMLQKEVYLTDVSYPDWTLDRALSEAQTAYSIDSLPVYRQQQAQVLYAQKKYQEACDIYLELQNTRMQGPETMIAAVQCKQAMGAPFEDVMALMDSTVNSCPHPLTYQSAPYVLQRGLLYQNHGDFRKAMLEYASYEKLMVGYNLPAEFFYNRFVCERECKAYQQALDDINKAIEKAPREPLYVVELASMQLRLNQLDDAVTNCNRALILNSQNADAYAILGVAQCLQGKKHEGLLNLEQAKSLGYENADALMQKYK